MQLPPPSKLFFGAIALGSNLGDPLATVKAAVQYLDCTPALHVVRVSRWYGSQAITGGLTPPQPDYVNGCAIVQTSLDPHALLAVLLKTELHFGRQRRERWAARTLDLDLLLYENRIVESPELIVPHPRMGDRAFVLLPLAEIAPDWIHPINGKTIAVLANEPADLSLSRPCVLDA